MAVQAIFWQEFFLTNLEEVENDVLLLLLFQIRRWEIPLHGRINPFLPLSTIYQTEQNSVQLRHETR